MIGIQGSQMETPEALAYYATQSAISAAPAYRLVMGALPDDVPALVRAVRGLMVHVFWADRYGLSLSPERQGEVQLRYSSAQLARIFELDARPLSVERPPERRLVGNCRDFSTLLAMLLRELGVPARARCGFGRYFLPNHFEDHWVCEYWNAAQTRWVLVDAQVDALQQAVLQTDFDTLDVPRDQFIVAGKAWQMCRAGRANPNNFGIFDMHGYWFIRGNLARDVAALNKVEMLPWDGWGIGDTPDSTLTPDDYAALDYAAALTAADQPDFAALRVLDADARFHVPARISSYLKDGPKIVELNP